MLKQPEATIEFDDITVGVVTENIDVIFDCRAVGEASYAVDKKYGEDRDGNRYETRIYLGDLNLHYVEYEDENGETKVLPANKILNINGVIEEIKTMLYERLYEENR